MRCAAIDLGTNTARLLIGDIDSDRLTTIRIEREIIRLGGGFSHERGLSDSAQQRAMDCLKRFSEIMKEYGVQQIRSSATSAVRDALNGPAFVEKVLEVTGIMQVVIDGDLEGKLTLKGVISGLDVRHDNMVVVDVGGGSTEITISGEDKTTYVASLPLGVVRLTEGFGSVQSMCARISDVLREFKSEISAKGVIIKQDSVMIATAGTATTLAAIMMEMVEYDYRRVNNYLLSKTEIIAIYDRLLPLEPRERLLIPGLEAGREDLIIAGILIILNVMDCLGFSRLKVSDYGLLEGLALSGGES
ncbi:MAG: exopolyphosphatase [Deltaproteobacteria bacterium]|nr:exopolyphosphatase [Deltaproteobacteria bacterium]